MAAAPHLRTCAEATEPASACGPAGFVPVPQIEGSRHAMVALNGSKCKFVNARKKNFTVDEIEAAPARPRLLPVSLCHRAMLPRWCSPRGKGNGRTDRLPLGHGPRRSQDA